MLHYIYPEKESPMYFYNKNAPIIPTCILPNKRYPITVTDKKNGTTHTLLVNETIKSKINQICEEYGLNCNKAVITVDFAPESVINVINWKIHNPVEISDDIEFLERFLAKE